MNDFPISFLIWCLGVFGTANIIVFSTLLKPMRDFFLKRIPIIGKLVTCILCMGFWCGVFWGLVLWSPAELLYLRAWQFYMINVFDILFNGCVGSAISWLIYLWIAPRMVGK